MDGSAVAAAREVAFNLESEFRREIAFQVIRQLPADLVTIDFYNARLLRHEHHRLVGFRCARKVTYIVVLRATPSAWIGLVLNCQVLPGIPVRLETRAG